MNYLGQPIELIEQDPGWIGIWWHPVGCIQVGFFPTSMAAWEAVVELIERSVAVQALLEVVEDWREMGQISDSEYITSFETLVDSVLV